MRRINANILNHAQIRSIVRKKKMLAKADNQYKSPNGELQFNGNEQESGMDPSVFHICFLSHEHDLH